MPNDCVFQRAAVWLRSLVKTSTNNRVGRNAHLSPAGNILVGVHIASPSAERFAQTMKRSKVTQKDLHSVLPKPLPSHLARPSDNSFLRNEPPYQESFQAALQLPYHGFVVDETVLDNEAELQDHLKSKNHWFRQDITQPFGGGTKCAKTYVTRCLMGDAGTTYKYLGLRMFAHAWTAPVRILKDHLAERTKFYLEHLDGNPKGRAAFDVCLINCMEASPKLKLDSSHHRTAVSWHADSSLEHYSTIAVYQTLLAKNPTNRGKDEWSIGLRVAPFAEGPKTGAKSSSNVHESTPPIAVSLPSNSAYYLLDDFNHHHQHTVFTDTTIPSVQRYSLTFRLLREGHTAQFQLERCQRAVASFNKKGTKLFRSEQLLLTEIESEWLRQFYIQGKSHHSILQEEWGGSLRSLWKYWSLLEHRTYQILQFFRNAAEANGCSRPNKKLKKSLDSCRAILERESVTFDQFVAAFVTVLTERNTIRQQWRDRENESVFQTVPEDLRPMSLPVTFATTEEGNESLEEGRSPLPEDLSTILDELKHLPMKFTSTTEKNQARDQGKAMDWPGWDKFEFALEMQSPWAEALLEGRKTIETRSYKLPEALIGKKIAILRTPCGVAGKSTLMDRVDLLENDGPKIIGWCVFESVVEYTKRSYFQRDQSKHLVDASSGYSWKEGTQPIFGWIVKNFEQVKSSKYSHAVRCRRSLFQLFTMDKPQHPQPKATFKSADQKANSKPRKKRRF